MRDEIKVAALLGRLLELMGKSSETTDDHRAAMHALADVVGKRSMALMLTGAGVTVEGEEVPEATPYIGNLRDRMVAHGLTRLFFAHGASATDLVEIARALVAPPLPSRSGEGLAERLTEAHVVTVTVITREQESAAAPRRAVRVTEALQTPSSSGAPQQLLVESPSKESAFAALERRQRAAPGTLAAAVERLQDANDPQPILHRLDGIQVGIVKAIGANELTQALEAILRLVRQEGQARDPDLERAYGIALRRLLTAEHLKKFAPMVFDEVYHEDVALVMRRAGKQGTKILLDLLIEAPSQAERRAYLKALRQVEEGADVIASLLSHHEWFVVRNAADLVGEMRIVEAVPSLAKASQNDDARVRRAIGLALARIGTAETALPLRRLVTDPDPQVRLSVVKEVGGRTLSGLAMPLLSAASAEQDPGVLSEYYRALGRIGTPDAVQGLIKAAQDTGKLLSRRPAGPRLAAIEGLGLAGGPAAIAVLKELVQNRSGDVRAAAAGALERATTTEE